MLDGLKQDSQKNQIEETYKKFTEKMFTLISHGEPTQSYFIAETGSGKSKAIVEFIKVYGGRYRLVLVLNSKEEVEAKYSELISCKGLNAQSWLSEQNNTYQKSDLKDVQIAIVTHQFFTNASNRHYLGQRDAIIVDETPIWEKCKCFDSKNLHDARERSTKNKSQLESAIKAYEWMVKAEPATKYLPLTELAYPELFAGLRLLENDSKGDVREVLEAAEAGRAMLHTDRFKNPSNSPVVIRYPSINPLQNDKVMIVSATAHLEGSQLSKEPPAPDIVGNFRDVKFIKCEWPDITKNVREAPVEDQDSMFDLVEQILRKEPQSETLIIGYKPWKSRFEQRLKREFVGFSEDNYEINGKKIHLIHHGSGVGSNSYRNCREVIYIGLNHIPEAVDLVEVFYHTGDEITAKSLQEAIRTGGPLDQLRQGKREAELKQMIARGCCRHAVDGMASPMRAWLIVPSDQAINTDLNNLFPNCQVSDQPTGIIYKQRKPYQVKAKLLQVLAESDKATLRRSEVDRLYAERFGISSEVVNKSRHDIPKWLEGTSWEFKPENRGRGGEARFVRVK